MVISFLLYKLFAAPQPKWDTSAESRIAYTSPGLMEIDFGYIPDVQIWGDGTIVWVDDLPNSNRHVYKGELSKLQIHDILQSLIDSGMFNIIGVTQEKDQSCTYLGEDNELHIELIRARRRVLIRNNNEQVCSIVNYLASGADLEGQFFEPKTGIIYPILLEVSNAQPVEEWHLSTLPFDFDAAIQARGQFEIEGIALELVWEFVNQHPDPIVTYQGNIYRIGLLIPELSSY